jgi:putative MATE family efflux protein
MLATETIGKLLFRLSLPAIVGMLVTALYNVVDTIFVGHAVGTVGIGGLSVVFPIQVLLIAVAQTFGIGGASRISRCMGAKDTHGAGLTFGNMVLLAMVAGFGFLILGLVIPVPLMYLFGATETILPSALEYFKIINLSSPLMAFIMATNNAVRAEGNAGFAMLVMMLGAGLNILLDPVFIFVLDMGIRGAAIATVISNAVGCILLGIYFARRKSEIPVGWRFFRLDKGVSFEILAVGASSFARSGAMGFTTILLNHTLRTLGGDVGIATFGIIFRLLMFLFMPLNGITQGLQPIVGFNYGARQFGRVRQSIKIASVWATCAATAAFIVLLAFPEFFIRCFTSDPDLVASGVNALRCALFCLPLAGYQIIGGGVFQALGKAIPALLLTLSRQVLILIPLVIILPNFFGLNGVWYAFPVSDAASFLITWILIKSVLGQIPRH